MVLCKTRHLVTSLRTLIAKWCYEPELFTAEDVFSTHEIYQRTVALAESDYNFRFWLQPLKGIESIIRSLCPNPEKQVHKMSLWAVDGPGVWFIPDKFYYFGEKGQERQLWRFDLRVPRKPRPFFKRFIGVGYRDKGNLRSSSWNGSASWQEVMADRRSPLKTVGYVEGYNTSSNPPLGQIWPRNGLGKGKSQEKIVRVTGHTPVWTLSRDSFGGAEYL